MTMMRHFLAIVSALLLSIVPAYATMSFDMTGTNFFNGSGPGTLTVSTANSGDIVVIGALSNGGATLTPTSAHVTWHLVGESTASGSIEDMWWGYASSALSSEVITVHQTADGNFMTLEALGIHTTASFNSSNPIDSNGSATNASTVGGVDAIISTTASAAFTVGSSRHSVPNPTPGSGFTQVPGTGGEYNLLEYKVVASPQTNMDFTNAGLVEEAVGTAFVESAGSSGQPHSMTLGTGFH